MSLPAETLEIEACSQDATPERQRRTDCHRCGQRVPRSNSRPHGAPLVCLKHRIARVLLTRKRQDEGRQDRSPRALFHSIGKTPSTPQDVLGTEAEPPQSSIERDLVGWTNNPAAGAASRQKQEAH